MPYWMEVRCSVNGPKCHSKLNEGPMMRSFNGSFNSAYQAAMTLTKAAYYSGWTMKANDFICPGCQAWMSKWNTEKVNSKQS